jgi:hypothetical protein
MNDVRGGKMSPVVFDEKMSGQIWRSCFGEFRPLRATVEHSKIRVATFLAFQYQPGLRVSLVAVKTWPSSVPLGVHRLASHSFLAELTVYVCMCAPLLVLMSSFH